LYAHYNKNNDYSGAPVTQSLSGYPIVDALERYMYDPYGNVTVLDADWTADANGVSDYENSLLYCGYYHDSETGLYHVRNRMYHPLLGRWITRDPGGYQDGLGVYTYARANPILYFDPDGARATKEEKAREAEQRRCKKKRAERRALIAKLKKGGVGVGECDPPCETITVIIKLPDPCDKGWSGKGMGAYGSGGWF